MVENKNCLQLTSEITVPCRESKVYYPKGICPLESCKARVVLEDPQALERVVGGFLANHLGPQDERTIRLVFHKACPGYQLGTPIEVLLNNQIGID